MDFFVNNARDEHATPEREYATPERQHASCLEQKQMLVAYQHMYTMQPVLAMHTLLGLNALPWCAAAEISSHQHIRTRLITRAAAFRTQPLIDTARHVRKDWTPSALSQF
jgi:hypothetical protein